MNKSVPALALIALLLPAPALPQAATDAAGVYEKLNLFGEAFERIRHDAVDPVTDKKLVQTAIAGMLAGLDPNSVYLSESEYKALQDRTPEKDAGIGLVVTLEKGELKVVSPQDGSPAAAADIKPGDIIFTIDKEPTYDLTLPEIEQKLRGPAGSEVALMLRRDGGKPTTVKLKRVNEQFSTISHRLEAGDIGYVRVAGFTDQTSEQLSAAINDLRQQAGNKLAGFVLDLRNDPGGSFDAAVKVADAVLDKGDIAIIKSRNNSNDKHIAATPGDLSNGQPIVALVNGGTAREAELVAGALQDNKRAMLLGSKTFGESAIETLIPLKGNGAIKLTTARFATPNGRAIQGKGLDPDLEVSPLKLQKVAQGDRLREADLHGALKNPDAKATTPGSTPAGGATPGKTSTTAAPPTGEQPTVASGDIGTPSDEQLSEAIDVLHGLAVVNGRTASAAR